MSASKVYRVAVLSGAGHTYMPLAMAAHPRFTPVVVAEDASAADWCHERGEALARQLQVPYVRNIEQAIADFTTDVACVLPNTARNVDLSERAATAGQHIWQDKPMAESVADCDRIVAAVERAGVRFQLYTSNTLAAIRQARRMLDAGDIGLPYAIHVDFYFAKDAGVLRDSGETEAVPPSWLSGGELSVEGIYPLAYIQSLLRVRVQKVFARTTAHFFQRHADRGVEDLASVTLEMERGIVGSLCIGRIGRPSHPNTGEIKLHILGSHGALVIAQPRPEVAVYARSLKPTDSRHRSIADDVNALQLHEFARAIDNGGPTATDARLGRAICATVVAAKESARTGAVVAVA